MEEKTKESYRKLAIFHIDKMGKEPYFSAVKEYLESIAPALRPDYFRRLRNAIAFSQVEAGYSDNAKKINTIQNPTTANNKKSRYGRKKKINKDKKLKVKPKQKRVKFVNEKDKQGIYNFFKSTKDKVFRAIFLLIEATGCRPAEVESIKVISDKCILIKGAKKTRDGNRGLDRIVSFEQGIPRVVKRAIYRIKNKEGFKMANYQAKMDYRMKQLFPLRKHRANFYTFRHMHGSKLKNSEFNAYQIAYLMGHQSTESVAKYGDKRFDTSSSPLRVKPGVSMDKIKTLVRDNRTDFSLLAKKGSSYDFTTP